jgi:hypothetical protein
MKEMETQLQSMLIKLITGELEAIEYGDQSEPGGFHSAFRICYMQTAGGMQFRLSKLLLHRGESTLGYFGTSAAQCIACALTAIEDYHRPTCMSERLKQMRQRSKIVVPELSWYPVSVEIVSKHFMSPLHMTDFDKEFKAVFGESEVFTLPSP